MRYSAGRENRISPRPTGYRNRCESIWFTPVHDALYTKDSCLRASPRHGGQEVFLHFSHRSAVGATLRGRRQSSYLRERVVTIPVSYLDKTIFIGNAQEQAKRLRGFQLHSFGYPHNSRTPQKGNSSSSPLSAGAVWGDRHCPLLHRTSALYFTSL